MKNYCTQNEGDCKTCSLTNYNRDCCNNPLTEDEKESKEENGNPPGRAKKEAVMQIEVEYEKTDSGKIRTCLTVVASHDYPTVHIFEADTDYPQRGCFSLEPSEQPYIIFVAETPEEAREFVQEQIEALKRHLADWQAVIAPQKEKYTI